MLVLEEKIAEGGEREVYRHPAGQDRLVKIMKSSARDNRNRCEFDWLRAANADVTKHVAKLFEFAATNLGEGLVCEFIRDEDGRPSQSILDCLVSRRVSASEAERLILALYDWANQIAVPICDSGLVNVLYQKSVTPRLVLIDGFGPGHGIMWRMKKHSASLIRNNNDRKRRRALKALAAIA